MPRSGPPENGKVRVTGVRGPASIVATRRQGDPCTLIDNGDGTADIVLPQDIGDDEGFYVIWDDDSGRYYTPVVTKAASPGLADRLAAVEDRLSALEGR